MCLPLSDALSFNSISKCACHLSVHASYKHSCKYINLKIDREYLIISMWNSMSSSKNITLIVD